MSRTPRTPRAPRRRTAIESLLSIVLVLEALLVFFVTLVVFALDILPPAVAFTGGGVSFVLMIAVGRMLSRPYGVWLGWALQVVLIATGILVPLMYAIGVGFAALWTYCFITGRRLDKRNNALLAEGSGPTDSDNNDNDNDNDSDTKETP